jgi:UDP-glucose 4-epimerase
MKILVTGGAGFIGSNLCEKLVKDKKNKVYSLDNYSTGRIENHVDNVTYIRGETSDIDSLVNFSPSIIYHLGEYSRVEQSFDDVRKLWKSNKNGTFSVLEFARKTKAKLIYAGSSTKFSDGGSGRNQSPYAWTKASNTELVVNYGVWYQISYVIVYFYNVYGKREIEAGKYATLIALFKKSFINRENLKVVSPGTQQRNFTHIDDIIDGIIIAAENAKSYSVLEIAKMFNIGIDMLPERRGNRMAGEVISQKIQDLGWEAKHGIKDYIDTIVRGKE